MRIELIDAIITHSKYDLIQEMYNKLKEELEEKTRQLTTEEFLQFGELTGYLE